MLGYAPNPIREAVTGKFKRCAKIVNSSLHSAEIAPPPTKSTGFFATKSAFNAFLIWPLCPFTVGL